MKEKHRLNRRHKILLQGLSQTFSNVLYLLHYFLSEIRNVYENLGNILWLFGFFIFLVLVFFWFGSASGSFTFYKKH